MNTSKIFERGKTLSLYIYITIYQWMNVQCIPYVYLRSRHTIVKLVRKSEPKGMQARFVYIIMGYRWVIKTNIWKRIQIC